MPTYQNVTARVRALIDDLPNHYADDTVLLEYVNSAQGQLVGVLASQGVREGVLKTSMLVPAGTTRIDRWPAQATVPNELAFSDAFTLAAVPNGWVSVVGTPSVSTGLSDPEGGSLGKSWSFASGSNYDLYTAGAEVAAAMVYFGAASLWIASGDSDAPYNVRILAGIADANGPIAETLEHKDIAVTSEWQRVFVPFSQKVITTVTSGALRRCLQIQITAAAPVSVKLYRAVIRPTYADTPDTATNGNAMTVGREPVLPSWLLVPDRLLDRKPGDGSSSWTLIRGPLQVRDAPGSARITQWDWRAGGIDLGPAMNDRELMIEGWGTLPEGQLGVGVIEEELPITGSLECLVAITCGLVALARNQQVSAARFGVMTEQGNFSGMAGGLVANLVNVFNKAQQSEPIRRQPYFGVARYPGVAGNGVGGWPWNSV